MRCDPEAFLIGKVESSGKIVAAGRLARPTDYKGAFSFRVEPESASNYLHVEIDKKDEIRVIVSGDGTTKRLDATIEVYGIDEPSMRLRIPLFAMFVHDSERIPQK